MNGSKSGCSRTTITAFGCTKQDTRCCVLKMFSSTISAKGRWVNSAKRTSTDQVLENNRRRFEEKWGTQWKPHARRITREYSRLRDRIRAVSSAQLPAGSTIAVISKGDDELLKLNGHQGWHFPRAENGRYANQYPADGPEALAQLKAIRKQGARFLLIPKTALWWLEHYGEFTQHLESCCRLALKDEESCWIFDLEESHG